MEGKRSRAFRWAVGVSTTLALLMGGVFVFRDGQIRAQIRREENLLRSMGIDMNPLPPDGDAYNQYYLLSRELWNESYVPQPFEKALPKFLAALEKPYISLVARVPSSGELADPMDRILAWMDNQGVQAAAKHDWAKLDQLFRLELGLRAQLLAGPNREFLIVMLSEAPPLSDLDTTDAEVNAWKRRKWESMDMKTLLINDLSSLIRTARTFGPEPAGTPGAPVWKRAVENLTIFRQSADLSVLRHFRLQAQKRLAERPLLAYAAPNAGNLLEGLKAEGSWPSAWAVERTTLRNESYRIDWITEVLALDLRQSKASGRPLVPTWSKPFCIDPVGGGPISVTTNKKGFGLSASSSKGMWNVEGSW